MKKKPNDTSDPLLFDCYNSDSTDYDILHKKLVDFILSRLPTAMTDMAADIAQEAMLDFIRARRKYEYSHMGLLFHIARVKCAREYKRYNIQTSNNIPFTDDAKDSLNISSNHSSKVQEELLACENITLALETLVEEGKISRRDAGLWWEHIFEGETTSDIAQKRDLKCGTVRGAISRVTKKIRDKLKVK